MVDSGRDIACRSFLSARHRMPNESRESWASRTSCRNRSTRSVFWQSLPHIAGGPIETSNGLRWLQSGTALAGTSLRRIEMLYTLAVILLIAWLLGVVGTYTIGAFVHVLLVVAVVLFLVGLITGRETIA